MIGLRDIIKQIDAIGIGENYISPSDSVAFNALIYSYDGVNSTANDEEILNVFKGAVICEKYFGSCGSATPASRIYNEIHRRCLDPNYNLADWAFQYSDNEYIPFGFIRHGEKTAYEYLQWREDFHLRIMQEQLDAEARKTQQIKRAKEIAKQKMLSDVLNQEKRNEIMHMEPLEQVQTIIDDKVHNLLFYMPVINRLLHRSDVPKQCLHMLLDKVSLMKATPFNKRLINDISKQLNDENHNLRRFIDAQHGVYPIALRELKDGRKRSHWMWYIFPQLKHLVHSNISKFYGISGKEEAAAYLAEPILGQRLRDVCDTILDLPTDDAREVFGSIDAMKLRSSMTLFDIV